jgi:hypothetical protein
MYCSFAICLVRYVVDIFGASFGFTSLSLTYGNRAVWAGWNGGCGCCRAGRLPSGSGLGTMDDWRRAGFAAWIVVAYRISAPITDLAFRLPQVHDTVKQGLVTYTIAIARQKGFTAYLGEGKNRWPAAHVNDVARLYRLALEKNVAGSRYNAVAEEGITAREIAEVTAKGLKQEVKSLTPEEAKEYFGWMAMFAGMDLSASSKLTRERLGWTPTGPGLIADLEAMKY